MTPLEAAHRYVKDPNSAVNSKHTAKGVLSIAGRLTDYTGGIDMAEIEEPQLVDFLNSLDVSASTLHFYRKKIQGLFLWSFWRGDTDQDEASRLKQFFPQKPQPTRKQHWLSPEQVERILDMADCGPGRKEQRDRVVLRLGFTCGLRREEITKADWEDVDWEEMTLTIVGKGGKVAQVALNQNTMDCMSDWHHVTGARSSGPIINPFKFVTYFGKKRSEHHVLVGERLHPDSINTICDDWSQRTGIKFTPHDMRRSYAAMVNDAIGVEGASAALRHSNIGTTQVYLERRQDAAAQAGRKAGIAL